mmetsp:Transcript_28261/g.32381  ORF Transcript_28261/g.32381 Transcript_28261/m.32381 type:complete len:107 (+) Transcript_28261:531-851(+)
MHRDSGKIEELEGFIIKDDDDEDVRSDVQTEENKSSNLKSGRLDTSELHKLNKTVQNISKPNYTIGVFPCIFLLFLLMLQCILRGDSETDSLTGIHPCSLPFWIII